MSRKEAITSLFLNKPAAVTGSSPAKSPDRVRTGAIGAMGSSLQEMAESAKSATRLQQQLAAGEAVIGIRPEDVDGSLILDRIPTEIDSSFDALVSSIKENGQQVPILVRPHPDHQGRFQVAYGRRRLRAAALLGQTVKAIVRNLTDSELVIAQGRENLDRQDLSFIEKALFARSLEDAGYERATIIAALSTDKADLSRYITIARRIPEELLKRIGSAPKAGRARWTLLADKLDRRELWPAIERFLDEPSQKCLGSDARLAALLKHLDKPARSDGRKPGQWATPQGNQAGRIEHKDSRTILTFDETVVPDFADFIAGRLDELYRQYREDQSMPSG